MAKIVRKKVADEKPAAPKKKIVKKGTKKEAPAKKSGVTEIEIGSVSGKKAKKKVTKLRSGGQLAPTVDSKLSDVTLNDYTDHALKEYGTYVVQDRAVPDKRDGLKPSHRAMLWSVVDSGCTHTGAYVKSARITGKAIGDYHPHGDKACYESGVTIANFNVPLIDGAGNFGSPVDNPAAMRYSEMRLSRFSAMFMVDKRYLEAVPLIDNFALDRKWPLFLPALLPTLLIEGNVTIPAYGVRAGNPAFELSGIVKLTLAALKGRKLKLADLERFMKVKHPYGAICRSSKEDLSALLASGRGSLTYAPIINAEWKTKRIIIRSFSPGSLSNANALDKTLKDLRNMDGVSSAAEISGRKNPDSGPFGCCIYVTPQRGTDEDAFNELALRVRDKLTKSESYALGVTERRVVEQSGSDDNPEIAPTFAYCNFLQFFEEWVAYRIELEVSYLKHFMAKAEFVCKILRGKIKVCASADALDRAIKIIRTAKEPKASLMKEFKLDEDQVEAILSMQLRSLAKLALADVKSQLAAVEEELADYQRRLKAPGKSAANDLSKRVKAYIQKPDIAQSHVPVFIDDDDE